MNKLNASQTQQLREIVAYLKQKRQEQSLSLEQIASRTFIRLHILQALESASVENLPELIYVQGFIRRYGDMLNLDGDRLAKQLTQSSSAVAVKTVPTPSPRQEKAKAKTRVKPETSLSDSVSTSFFSSYWLYLSIMGVTILGILYLLFKPSTLAPITKSSTKETTTSVETKTQLITPKPEEKPITRETTTNTTQPAENPISEVQPSPISTETTTNTTQPAENSVSEVKPSPVTSPVTTEPNAPLSVAVALKGASWLKIEVDGKTEYEGILQEGEQKTWTAKENLKIRAGNAGAVTYSVNQQLPQSLGELGEVKEITLTP